MKEDEKLRLSDDEKDSPWIKSNEESTMGLIQWNSSIFIEINDREESDWISLTNLLRVFLSTRRGPRTRVFTFSDSLADYPATKNSLYASALDSDFF